MVRVNFRLLFLIESDLQSFLKYCDNLRQWNKQTVVEIYRWYFIITMKLLNHFIKFKWYLSVNCFQANWALMQLLKVDNIHIQLFQQSCQRRIFRSLFEQCIQENSVNKETCVLKEKQNVSTIAVIHLFFLMGIFLKYLWLIPNILKWQDCKIFTKLVSSQTPSRSSHQRGSVKKGVLKNLRDFTGKHLRWTLGL